MIPPAEPVKLDTPPDLQAITLRISNIQPCGTIMVYSIPFRGMPTRFDVEHPEQRIEATSGHIWTQKTEGAESFELALVSTERDPQAAADADTPKPIRLF